jgi:bacillithiol biosynthesis deacetylase BshB1
MKLDILVFAAHPDDAELGCGGTIISHVQRGKKVGIIDLTRGELGTRGTAQTRDQEAADAAQILGLSVRENMQFADGFFLNDQAHQLAIIAKIRQYQPDIVLCNAPHDRHPDHAKGANLLVQATFLSGLQKIVTTDPQGNPQAAWRPQALYHYIQDTYLKPDFVVDISAVIEQKIAAVKAFKTQFYDPNSSEPATYISDPRFLERIYARSLDLGKPIGFQYGEGFIAIRHIGVQNLFDLA